jgi:hypothetical protein
MVNVAVALEPVRGEYGTLAPPPPLVPSQLSGPRKNRPAAGTSGSPEPTGAQPLIVTWTTEPTGPAAGQTVIDESGSPEPVAVAHPAAEDVVAGVEAVVTGAEGAGAVAGAAVDGGVAGDVAAEALRWVFTAAGAAAGAFELQAASTAVAAQAVTRMATDRRVDITGLLS